ncbi:MAG: hypothetical protein Q8M53_02185 [Burkholderiales bacterium]|nr:hypothetical protein [Burkholderiales bacterium]
MKPQTILAIILIAAGSIGLAYGGYTYTRETTGMKPVPLELKVEEKEAVNVPLTVSAGAIVVGLVLLVGDGRK